MLNLVSIRLYLLLFKIFFLRGRTEKTGGVEFDLVGTGLHWVDADISYSSSKKQLWLLSSRVRKCGPTLCLWPRPLFFREKMYTHTDREKSCPLFPPSPVTGRFIPAMILPYTRESLFSSIFINKGKMASIDRFPNALSCRLCV